MLEISRIAAITVSAFIALAPANVAIGDEHGAQAVLAKIRISVAGQVILADIQDHATSRDFISRLPMTVVMTRSGEREYHGRPAQPISKDGPKQTRFENGDIGYWAPGGYLAIFLDKRVKPEIADLIVMGKVTSSLAEIKRLGESEEMTFELVSQP